MTTLPPEARAAEITTTISVHSGNAGIDSQAWAALLRRMYLRWAISEGVGFVEQFDAIVLFAPPIVFDNERGIHRLVRISPFDAKDRRHTCFAAVDVNNECSDEQARSYVLNPYQLVEDHRTGVAIADAQGVLDGALGPFLNYPTSGQQP